MFAVTKNFEPRVGNISEVVENANPKAIVSNSVGEKLGNERYINDQMAKGKSGKFQRKFHAKIKNINSNR